MPQETRIHEPIFHVYGTNLVQDKPSFNKFMVAMSIPYTEDISTLHLFLSYSSHILSSPFSEMFHELWIG